MAWRETARAKAARIRRTWECDVCEHRWFTVHDDGDTYVPECPMCESLAATQEMPLPGVKTNASRAVELAWQVAQERGMTDMRDHLRKGDTAAMPPPPIQGAESEAIVRAQVEAGAPPELGGHLKGMAESFWGAGVGLPGRQVPNNPILAALPQTPDAARMMVGGAAAQARSMNEDPVGLLHEAGKRGLDPTAKRNLLIHSKGPPPVETPR